MGRGMPRRELAKKGERGGLAEGAVTVWDMNGDRTCSGPVHGTDRHDGVCLTTVTGRRTVKRRSQPSSDRASPFFDS